MVSWVLGEEESSHVVLPMLSDKPSQSCPKKNMKAFILERTVITNKTETFRVSYCIYYRQA